MTDQDRIKLQRLFDGFGDAALEDPEMARQILADAGLDADRLAVEGATFARGLYGAARLRAASVGRAEMQQQVVALRDRVAARVRAAGGDFKTELARLLSGGDAVQLQAHFRKIEDLKDEDALDMLTDAEILRLLDETAPPGPDANQAPRPDE
jgi:hypothetical protein